MTADSRRKRTARTRKHRSQRLIQAAALCASVLAAPATVEAQRLDPPDGVKVTAGYSRLQVTWDPLPGAGGYLAQLSETNDFPRDARTTSPIIDSNDDTYTFTHAGTRQSQIPLKQNVKYWVRVRGTQAVGSGDWSTVGPTTLLTGKVMNLKLMPGIQKIDVSWDKVPGAEGYRIEWKSPAQTFDGDRDRQFTNPQTDLTIRTIGPSTIPDEDKPLTPGTVYTVRVQARSIGTGSEWTEKTDIPTLAQVATLTVAAKAAKPRSLEVSFTPLMTPPDVDHYEVQWSSDGQNWEGPITHNGVGCPVDGCLVDIPKLMPGPEYMVRVRANVSPPESPRGEAVGDGPWSDVATGTPVFGPQGVFFDPPELIVTEGGQASYTARLNAPPGARRTVTLLDPDPPLDGIKIEYSTDPLAFTQDNWWDPQTVTVTVDENDMEYPDGRTVQIMHGVRAASTPTNPEDGGFPAAPEVVITVLDKPKGTPGVAISETALTVSEPEQTATYTVALTGPPEGAVNVNPMSADPTVARVSPNSLRFWDSNWRTPQTVTVTAVNDDAANPDGQRTTTITHQVEGYGGVTADPVQVTVRDDDGGGAGPGTDPEPDPEPDPALGQVTGVMVTPIVKGLEVSWNAEDNAERYRVRWRSVSGSGEGSAGSDGGYDGELITTDLSVVIPDLDPDTEYAVQVTALRGDEEGPASDEVRGTPLPEPPVITVTAAEESVTEGPSALAVFTLTADTEPASDLSVVVEVGQTGGYLAADDTGRREVMLPAGELEATVEVSIEDDTVEEEDAGTVTLTLQPGDGYEVAESPADTASVTVEDDDRPRREEQERQERQRRQERRQTGLQRGMSEVATIVGWDTAMTIRDRSLGVQDGGTQMSAANLLRPFASRLTGGMASMGGGGMGGPMGGAGMNPGMSGMAGAGGMGGMSPMGSGAMGMGASGMGGMGGGAMGMSPMGGMSMGGGMGSMGAGMAPMAGPATQPTSLFSGATEFEMVLNGRSANPAPAPANPAALSNTNPALAHANPTALAAANPASANAHTAPRANAHANASPLAFENGRPVGAVPASAAGHAAFAPAHSASAHASANSSLAHADPSALVAAQGRSAVAASAHANPASATANPSALAFENGSALQPAPSPSGPLFRAWGRGAQIGYNNEALAGRRHDGDIRTILAGVDATWNSGLVFGVAAGLHQADVDFNDSMVSATGNMSVGMWSVNPYASFQNAAGVRVWGTAGVGQGTLDYGESGYLTASGLGMTTGAGGIEYEIASSGAFDVIGRTEGMFVNLDVDASSHPMVGYAAFGSKAFGGRGELEVGAPVRSDTVLVRPYGQVAYRWDGGDAELGSSVEYGGGVAIKGSTVFLDAAVRSLTNTSGSFESLGYSVAAGYDGGADKRGLSLRFEQSAGPTRYNPYGGGSGLPTTFLPTHAAGQSYRARGGYGLDFGSGLLTPYMSADWGGYSGRSRLDWGAAWERFGVSIGGSYSLTTVGAFGDLSYGGAFGSPFGGVVGAASRTGADHAVQAQAQIAF